MELMRDCLLDRRGGVGEVAASETSVDLLDFAVLQPDETLADLESADDAADREHIDDD